MSMSTLVDRIHGGYVHNRRGRILSQLFSDLLPHGARVLDVGCGDGLFARLLLDRRPDLSIEGIDVLVRDQTAIPVRPFDGAAIPYEDEVFDALLFVDVLHHADDPLALLRDAARVTRGSLLIKDHLKDRPLAGPILSFMDRVGNARHGVALPHNYFPRTAWDACFAEIGMAPTSWDEDLKLYPPWADWLFGGSLHFLARLEAAPR